MAGKGGVGDERSEPRPAQQRLPQEVLDIIYPALQVGALAGISGLFVGAFAGVIRSRTPVLFAAASGIQWFVLGTTFTASRPLVQRAWGEDRNTYRDRVSISAAAGGITGTVGGLLRGPRNIIPGAIVFALFGAAGHALYDRADTEVSKVAESAPTNRLDSWLDSKWSPMRRLSGNEYETMLRDKLLLVEADIALIDQNINALRDKERSMEAKSAGNQASGSKAK